MELIFENEIAVVAIIKNESRYISEWLEYHYRIGVDKFYIYDNDSEDRSELMKILDPWIQNHIVEYKFFPGICRQMPAYNDAIEKHRFDCRYMAFIDLDEFIFVKTGQTLLEFLNDFFAQDPRIAGLAVNWRMFGTSGRNFYEPIDVTERFTHRAPDNYEENFLIKTIADPRKIFYMPISHCAIYMFGTFCCDENFNVVLEYKNPANTCEKIQMNHYFTKSIEEYTQKISRGRADNGSIRQAQTQLNSILNEVHDQNLRDYYRMLKQQPLPLVKNHSEQKILENVEKMLDPFLNSDLPDEVFHGHMTKFLTCFSLIEKTSLLSKKDQSDMKILVLNYLQKSITNAKLKPHDWLLLSTAWREILMTNTKSAANILEMFYQVLLRIIRMTEDEMKTEQTFLLRQIQKDLHMILIND